MIIPQPSFETLTAERFSEQALALFRYQYLNNKVYRDFCDLLGKNPTEVERLVDIPFLPISFFKTHEVVAAEALPSDVLTFKSSGTTTAEARSTHYILNPEVYVNSFMAGFNHFYGAISSYRIVALLPSYQEQQHSSLIYMVDQLMRHSAIGSCYVSIEDDFEKIFSGEQKTLLIGVTYALLDLADRFQRPLKNTVVMETGGMKGRRKELVREEVHAQLKKAFGLNSIHSEYGMTELLSQAYSKGEGVFETPPWMRVLIREAEDPFTYMPIGRTGGINVIDFANVHSCSFIATDDLGRLNKDNTFEVLGRFDSAELRGCNLMMA
ncbi:MAG: acyl transferase [Flavobacteriaceae bacterium]